MHSTTTMAAKSSASLFLTATAFSLLFSTSSTATLLSLNCTQPPPHTTSNPSLPRLLDRFTGLTQPTHFAVSGITVNRTRVSGMVQCRSDLSPAHCKLCLRLARRTVLARCPGSEFIAAWFDGCYVEASPVELHPRSRSSHYCSRQPVPWVGFEPALDSLLVRLRTGLAIGVRDRFSCGESISVGGNTIYGFVECVRTLSTFECQSCAESATEKLIQGCKGHARGYVVHGNCFARFDTFEFFSSSLASARHEGGQSYGREEEKRDLGGWVRLVLVCWGVVVACLAGFGLCVWFVQRSIVNGAKVGVVSETMDSGKL